MASKVSGNFGGGPTSWFNDWTLASNETVDFCAETAIVLMARADCERLDADLERLSGNLGWLVHPRPHVRPPDMGFAPSAFAHLRRVVGRAVADPRFTLSFECPS